MIENHMVLPYADDDAECVEICECGEEYPLGSYCKECNPHPMPKIYEIDVRVDQESMDRIMAELNEYAESVKGKK